MEVQIEIAVNYKLYLRELYVMSNNGIISFAYQGEEMTKGCTVDDYAVYIGQGVCSDNDLKTNALTCFPPEEEPLPREPSVAKDGALQVLVGTLLQRMFSNCFRICG